MKTSVITGLENIKKEPLASLKGKNLGLLANPASLDRSFTHASQVISQIYPGQLKALFSPQHGFYAEKQDNMIESVHGMEPTLNIPIFSLYCDTRIPTLEMFDLIDVLLIDIQDVGTRVYTFIYTISHCLEVAAALNKKVIILDRPNPIGGIQVEGNILEIEYASFVGRFPIPMRHGMTVGEISAFFNRQQGIGCDLEIVPLKGWNRKMYFKDTGLAWVAPSPNLPSPYSCMVYPGQVIFEGTNISEGRGTTLPFEQFGAPFINIKKIKSAADEKIKGAILRPVCFEPTSGKFSNKICRGFHIHVIDQNLFKPYFASLILLQLIIKFHKNEFEYKPPPYEYEYDKLPMDLILGSRKIREQLDNIEDLTRIEQGWKKELEAFKNLSSKFYLYA
ncbi:MAG: DUF1343 domain-containing protein [Desulfobacteraceae bacterium]|nr:DUF1343 domain-containing protein [Desulfobacteraceae bacterium]